MVKQHLAKSDQKLTKRVYRKIQKQALSQHLDSAAKIGQNLPPSSAVSVTDSYYMSGTSACERQLFVSTSLGKRRTEKLLGKI